MSSHTFFIEVISKLTVLEMNPKFPVLEVTDLRIQRIYIQHVCLTLN